MTDKKRPSRWQALASIARVIACDAAAAGGCVLVTYGVWLIHQPSGFIAAGSFLLAAAILIVRAS